MACTNCECKTEVCAETLNPGFVKVLPADRPGLFRAKPVAVESPAPSEDEA